MSRTYKDRPWHFFPNDRGYPPPAGGAWSGIRAYVKKWWRRERRRVKNDLRCNTEPNPSRPRNQIKADLW